MLNNDTIYDAIVKQYLIINLMIFTHVEGLLQHHRHVILPPRKHPRRHHHGIANLPIRARLFSYQHLADHTLRQFSCLFRSLIKKTHTQTKKNKRIKRNNKLIINHPPIYFYRDINY